MNFFNNLFKTTKGLVEETLNGLKSLSKVSDIETKTQSKKLYELEANFTKNVGTVQEIQAKLDQAELEQAKLAAAELSAAESTKAKERVDLLTREKAGAEIVLEYIKNNKSLLSIIQDINKYKADLFSKNPDLKSKYYKEKYDNTLNANKNSITLGGNDSEESSTYNPDHNEEQLNAKEETVIDNTISEPANDFDEQIKKLKDILTPDQIQKRSSTEVHNLQKLLDIDQNVDDLISSLKPVGTVNHKQCQEYLNLITAASKSICDEVENKNNLEMNITIAEYLQKNKTKYTTADASGDVYKNFLYNLDAKINNRSNEEQEAIRTKKTDKYSELAAKIEQNIKDISGFFNNEDSKNLSPRDYEKKINQLTRDMQKSVLDLNREIKRLNIGPAVAMDNNEPIAKYNTLDVFMNTDLNKKIEDDNLNEKITKAFTGLEKGKTNKETQIIKEIDDLISEIDKFRANTFDKTTQNDNGNIYNNLQKKIETAINQNTQTNNPFYSNAIQILNVPVKTKINELKESNNKLNDSLRFIAEEKQKAESVKKNLLQRRSSGTTSEVTRF